jgi:hypothetical protein
METSRMHPKEEQPGPKFRTPDRLKEEFAEDGSLSLPTGLNFLAPLIVADLIRVGNSNDGGYVVPECCAMAVDTLISFGIFTDWSFEEHFRKLNPKIHIHAYDHTISGQRFKRSFQRGIVKSMLGRLSASELRERLRLWRSYKTFFHGSATHFEERIHNRIDSVQDATLDMVFARTSSNKIFLKVDIEGSEYRIIDDILKYADRITGMVIEFHETAARREVFCNSVKRLQERFEIVHLHGNNYGPLARDNLPEFLEFTFANRGSVPGDAKRCRLPLPDLDRPNHKARPDYEMRFSI